MTDKIIYVTKSKSGSKYHLLDLKATWTHVDNGRYSECGCAILPFLNPVVPMNLDDPRICKSCLRMYLKETGYKVK